MKYLNKVVINIHFPYTIVPFEELYFSNQPVRFYSDLEQVKVISVTSEFISKEIYDELLDKIYDLKDVTKYEVTGNNY